MEEKNEIYIYKGLSVITDNWIYSDSGFDGEVYDIAQYLNGIRIWNGSICVNLGIKDINDKYIYTEDIVRVYYKDKECNRLFYDGGYVYFGDKEHYNTCIRYLLGYTCTRMDQILIDGLENFGTIEDMAKQGFYFEIIGNRKKDRLIEGLKSGKMSRPNKKLYKR